MEREPLRIAIIVLNWNGRSDSLECLTSLRKLTYSNYEIIFADNGSTDGSIEAVRAEFPEVVILDNGANLGYAEGNNRGIRLALERGADAILVLNNDTTVNPELLNAFVESSNALPNAGMLGTVSFFYDTPELIAEAGSEWDPVALTDNHICKRKPIAELPSTEPFEVDFVIGCAVFITREVLERVGLLSPEFFLNGEDLDWSLRMRQAGLRNYTVPKAKIWHKIAVSFGGGSPLWRYFMTRNTLLWTKRHLSPSDHRRIVWRSIRELLPPADFMAFDADLPMKDQYWRFLAWIHQVRTVRGQAEISARLHGIYHFYRNRLGDCPQALRQRLIDAAK